LGDFELWKTADKVYAAEVIRVAMRKVCLKPVVQMLPEMLVTNGASQECHINIQLPAQ